MHTIKSGRLTVHHNSDWSGYAIIMLDDDRELQVPAMDFIGLAKEAANARMRDALIAFLEEWDDEG